MRLIALAAAVSAALMLPTSAAPKKGTRSNAVGVTRWPAPLRGVGGHAMGACAPLRELHLPSLAVLTRQSRVQDRELRTRRNECEADVCAGSAPPVGRFWAPRRATSVYICYVWAAEAAVDAASVVAARN